MAAPPRLKLDSNSSSDKQQQQQQQQEEAETPPHAKPGHKKHAAGKGWASAASGAMSGMLIGLLLQPLDVIGTRMKGESALGKTRNAFATATSIVRSRGIQGLWQGSAPSVIRMGLGLGLHMMLVDYAATALTKQLEGGGTHLSAFNAAIAGGVPRAIASILLNPITIIKTRMEYSGKDAVRYRNTLDAFIMITKAEGIRGLFRGLIPTILTNAPASALYYMFYTRLREHLAAPDRPQVLVNLTSGLVAAVSATVATQPFDVIRDLAVTAKPKHLYPAFIHISRAALGAMLRLIRTRVQLSRQGSVATGATAIMSGSLDALKIALNQHGPASLLVGALPRVLKRTAQTALVWTLYEELVPRLTAAYVGAAALVASKSNQQAQT